MEGPGVGVRVGGTGENEKERTSENDRRGDMHQKKKKERRG